MLNLELNSLTSKHSETETEVFRTTDSTEICNQEQPISKVGSHIQKEKKKISEITHIDKIKCQPRSPIEKEKVTIKCSYTEE